MSLEFDTLRVTKALRNAGFEEAQAEAVAVAVKSAVTDNVATKADVKELKSDMVKMETGIRSDMKGMEARMDVKFSALEAKIIEQSRDHYKHLLVTGLGIVGLTVALLKLL